MESKGYLQKKIIVIGAGISGLACASHLQDFGFKNVLILEAKERIGGRIHTEVNEALSSHCEMLDSKFIEYGAQWIHGEDGNIIYEIAHSKGLVDESAPNYYEALINFNSMYTHDQCQSIKSFIRFIDEKMEGIPRNLDRNTSFGEFLDDVFTEYSAMYQDDLDRVEFIEGIKNWYCKIHCEMSGCTDLSFLSARLLNQYKECGGLQTVELKNGFISVLNLFLQKLPKEAVLTGKVVKKIDWTDFKAEQRDKNLPRSWHAPDCSQNLPMKVKVICEDGVIYYADHVIVTVSLGFLKRYVDELFIPTISDRKLKAIESVGFGTVNKIFLEFSEPFWKPPAVYQVVWNRSLNEIFENDDSHSKAWLKDINRFAYSPGSCDMLCAWVVGKGAIVMENLPSEEISSHCMELLEKILGKELPKPKSVKRSTWFSDPYTQGSYSFLSLSSTKESMFHIGEPEITHMFCGQHPVIQFAGEATHPYCFSTVHGAYETGLREAQRLFEHYRYS